MRTNTTPHPSRSLTRRVAAFGAVALLGLAAAACGDDSKDSTDTTPATVGSGEVVIAKQWARTSPADAANGAIYFTITSPVDDKLTGAAVDASVAGKTEIHETVMAGSDNTMMGSDNTMMGTETTMGMGGGMTMQPVEFIELKAGQAVELKPGGYHVMLFGLVNPLKAGDTVKLTLTLEKAGQITVDVPVLDEAP